MKKHVIRAGFLLVLIVVLLYYFLKGANLKDAWRSLGQMNLPLFLLLVALTPIHFLSRTVRWRFILRHQKKDVTFYNAFSGTVIGFTVNVIFPRVGEVVRPLYLARKENMKTGFVLGTILVERIFDTITMCFLLGVFLLAKPLYTSSLKAEEAALANLYRWGFVGVGVALILVLFCVALYVFKEKALRVIAFVLKPLPAHLRAKILELFREFIEGLKFFTSVGDLLIYALLSQMVWLTIIFYYWLFFASFRVAIPYFLVFPYVFLTGVGASLPTPGMLGGFDTLSRLGMTSLYGLDPSFAIGLTVVVHLIQLVVTCILGYVILWKEGLSLFQLKKIGEDRQP